MLYFTVNWRTWVVWSLKQDCLYQKQLKTNQCPFFVRSQLFKCVGVTTKLDHYPKIHVLLILTVNSDSPTCLGTWDTANFFKITRISSLSSKASTMEENPWTTALQWAWYPLLFDNSLLGTSLKEKSWRYDGCVSNNLKKTNCLSH